MRTCSPLCDASHTCMAGPGVSRRERSCSSDRPLPSNREQWEPDVLLGFAQVMGELARGFDYMDIDGLSREVCRNFIYIWRASAELQGSRALAALPTEEGA